MYSCVFSQCISILVYQKHGVAEVVIDIYIFVFLSDIPQTTSEHSKQLTHPEASYLCVIPPKLTTF